ncbi:MAG TPA: hypothetical protein DEO40_06785, partial [Treponema sp.]|nr:hypothetical protein [Treponema sp.]
IMPIDKEHFIKLSGHVGFFPHTTNIGVIATEKKVYIIDSGTCTEDGNEICKAVKDLFPEKKLSVILNTHAHSDHTGGNAEIIRETEDCEIWASFKESRVMDFPESMIVLYYGAAPFKELSELSFSLQEGSSATRILKEETIEIEDGITIECFSLSGHYFEQLGYLVHDGRDGKSSFFLGDSCFGIRMLKKYWIPFMIDPLRFRDSIKKIESIPADFYIPSHGDCMEGDTIQAVAEMNIIVTLETETLILNVLKKAELTHEEVVEAVADYAGLEMKLGQFVLIGSTIKSYLSSLYDRGLVSFRMDSNRMLWRATEAAYEWQTV